MPAANPVIGGEKEPVRTHGENKNFKIKCILLKNCTITLIDGWSEIAQHGVRIYNYEEYSYRWARYMFDACIVAFNNMWYTVKYKSVFRICLQNYQ